VQGPYSDISRVLDGARRRRRSVVAASAVGWGGAAMAAALLAGAVGLGIGPGGMASWLRSAALAVAVIAGASATGWAGWALWRTAWGAPELAVTVAGGDDALRSALLTAVELERGRDELEARGLSTALADEHIARTGERARTIDLSRAVPDRPARRAGLALAAGLTAWGIAALVLGPDLGRGWSRLVAGAAPAVGAPRAEPITGDVEITYLYPAHTGRSERKVPGSDGAIQAPRGTEVRLSTRSDRPVKGARIAIEGANPEQRRSFTRKLPVSVHGQ
jgi:hypothetical protein